DDFLFQPVASLGIDTGYAVAQGMNFKTVHLAGEVAFFLVKESSAVGNQELGIADLRPINGGIVDFCEDTLRQREPDPAGGGIGGANAIFATVGPRGCTPRLAEGIAAG